MQRVPPAVQRTKSARGLAPWLAMAMVVAPLAAQAGEVTLVVEPDVVVPLATPQTERFGVGVGQSLGLRIDVTPFLDIGPTTTFQFLPAEEPYAASGVVWGLGGGVRLKRPRDAESAGGLSPWMNADLLFVQTGDLSRPGFDLGVGVAAPVNEARSFWVGPFVRYLQVLQPEHVGFDNGDANLLTFGLSFEAGQGKPVAAPAPAPAAVAEVAAPCDTVCPDLDADGVPDSVDRCPEVVGTADDYGCPAYTKIVVKKDKLELKEKLYFAWDEATLEEASFPVLDEVVQALKDNKGFRVQVEGHTDSSGGAAHNQTLSERRAQAVLDYLVAHGVSKDRLVSKGFSSSEPTDTNATVEGRENNRRVEFVVHFIILNDGSNK